MGVPPAPPLRSSRHLWGLPTAIQVPALAAKIFEANHLVEFSFELARAAQTAKRPWAMVNPEGSFLWEMKQWEQLEYEEWEVHACRFGGSRPFPRRVRSSSKKLATIGQDGKCNGQHLHRPWAPQFGPNGFKGFSSRKEAALPADLCNRIASDLKSSYDLASPRASGVAATLEVMATVQGLAGDENRRRNALNAAATGRQVRGRRLQQLVPEHKSVADIVLDDSRTLVKRRRLNAFRDDQGRTWPNDTQVLAITEGESSGKKKVKLGTPWSRVEFFELAKKVAHPFSADPVPSEPDLAVFNCVTLGPEEIVRRRETWFAKWERRARQLEAEEQKLAATLHPDVAERARKKKPLLLREILVETGFPSTDLIISMIQEGFPMFGPFPVTNVFPKREHMAAITKEEALKAAKWARPATAARKKPCWEAKVEEELRKVTKDELEAGECRGPFSAEELDRRYPGGWLAGPRIPVIQKKCIRPCEHYSAFGQNATASAQETVDTEGIDQILAMIKIWTRLLGTNSTVKLDMPDGSVREGQRHASYDKEESRALRGRLVDLKRAYKQLARSPKDADMSIFSLPGKAGAPPEFYEAIVLGFGARNAVLGFNYAARAIRHIANKSLNLAVTHFFDDYTQVDCVPLAGHSAASLERLLRLLGWTFKAGPEDLKRPASCFEPLGVRIDLTQAGVAIVGNTPKRAKAIAEEINRLVGAGSIAPSEIASLLGVCQYMEAQTAGRSGSLVMRNIRRAAGNRGPSGLENLKALIAALGEHVEQTVPRRIKLVGGNPPVLILTDAAAETSGSTFGAVLFDPLGQHFQFCAGQFSEGQVVKWKQVVGEQIICQAELAAAPIALSTWETIVSHREVLLFIDNEPAKDAAINGTSSSDVSAEMVHQMRLWCTKRGVAPWFERVPSPSNLADPPSRRSFEELLSLGATRVCAAVHPSFDIEFTEL